MGQGACVVRLRSLITQLEFACGQLAEEHKGWYHIYLFHSRKILAFCCWPHMRPFFFGERRRNGGDDVFTGDAFTGDALTGDAFTSAKPEGAGKGVN